MNFKKHVAVITNSPKIIIRELGEGVGTCNFKQPGDISYLLENKFQQKKQGL